MNNPIISFPLWETVSRSFMYLIKHLSTFFKLCSVFLILWIAEIATNYPELCIVNEAMCRTDTSSQIMAILIALASIIIGVGIIRHIILRQEPKWFGLSIGKAHLRYIGYSLLLAALVIIPTALAIIIGIDAEKNGSAESTQAFLAALVFITFLFCCILCFRFYLVFAAAAIDDKEMSLKKSFALTQGNTLKLCFGQILLIIPTAVIISILYAIYSMGQWGTIGNSIFVLLGLICSFFDSAVKASYYSHIYQYFLYQSKHQK